MPLGGTIAACATGAGFAPLAIVRLSGPETDRVLARLLGEVPAARRGAWATLRLPRAGISAGILDRDVLEVPVRVVRFAAPRSYTGEDAAEVTLPGSPHLVERVIDLVCAGAAVRRAEPGEFTARALLNDRLTIEQAEGVAQLIASSSEAQRLAAAALLSGETGRVYRQWADELTTLLALVEAGIDFTDQEDVVPIAAGLLADRLSSLHGAIRGRLGAEASREAGEGLPSVALAGAPSAGKSTLFNALLGRVRAMTAPEPGTTRDVLREELDLSCEGPAFGRVELLDLPGLDARGTDPVSRSSQRAAREALERADAVVWCDPTGRFDGSLGSRGSRGSLGSRGAVIRVRTKADLGGAGNGAGDALAVCALDGSNLGPLRRVIAESASGGAGEGAVLPRHRAHMSAAAEALGRAVEIAGSGEAELIAGELRAALDEIGALVGRVSADDVIGRIFSTFCVGK